MFTPKEEFFSERLQTLINYAYKGQWSPEDKIDWTLTPKLPAGLESRIYIDMVSQLYYAEEATIQVLGRLIQATPDLQAKQYLCTQAIDESRHARSYRKYLEKLGDIAAINENLQHLLETGLHWPGTVFGTIIALNVIMEGEALNQQNKRIQTLPCPLFKIINKAIVSDEARHAAFGKIYMKEKLKTICSEEKSEIYNWIKQLWRLWHFANVDRYTINNAALLRTEKNELEDRWLYQQKILHSIGLVQGN